MHAHLLESAYFFLLDLLEAFFLILPDDLLHVFILYAIFGDKTFQENCEEQIKQDPITNENPRNVIDYGHDKSDLIRAHRVKKHRVPIFCSQDLEYCQEAYHEGIVVAAGLTIGEIKLTTESLHSQ